MTPRTHRGELPGCLADVEDNTYHAVLTDPPYGLGEIRDPAALLRSWLDGEDGKQGPGMLARDWDVVVPPSAWREYLRVTRPGGLCFAFSHARTYHWQALAMQLAGWRILPFIIRIHGSAMALGHAVGKAIDKASGAEREVVGRRNRILNRTPSDAWDRSNDESEIKCGRAGAGGGSGVWSDITAPATPLAALFDGFNTSLKNQVEPIVVAVKPPEGTWAENAEKWGCGAFNVQAGRVPAAGDYVDKFNSVEGLDSPKGGTTRGDWNGPRRANPDPAGRYPSNLLLEHSPDCGADQCAPGCAVRELGEMGRERGVHSAGSGSPRGRLPPGDPNSRRSTTSSAREYLPPFRVDDAGEDSAARFFYQARAYAKERSAGCEHLLWRRAPEHPDGWELVDRETWERLGDEAAEAAKLTEGYMRTVRRDSSTPSKAYDHGRGLRHDRQGDQQEKVLDVDRLDAAAYLEAARARVRTTGNPGMCVKALDGTAHLAKLLLQPVVDGVKPRLLVPYSGSGSEAIGAMLAGWEEIDAWEGSEQWNVVHEARARFWREVIADGGVGSATDLLREWGTANGSPEAKPDDRQMDLFETLLLQSGIECGHDDEAAA